mgnify:CR=1 FL=1
MFQSRTNTCGELRLADAGDDEQCAGSQSDVGAILAEGNHQHVSRRKENNSK